jgi:thiamine-monophosphate kinase
MECMGEFELLARVRERLPPPDRKRLLVGTGDDAAVTVPAGATATSVDALVEGVHFDRERASLRQIGAKALATALSDLAAMGAEPGEAYTVLGVPPDLGEDDCLRLLDGLVEVAAASGTALAGGDLTRSPVLSLAITVVGHAPDADRLVTRSGARPGDALVLTGELGGAAAGLLLLEGGAKGHSSPPDVESLLARQLEPQPRLAAGRALAAAGARAMIDLSDGLGGDAGHLAAAGGVGLRIDAESLPLQEGVAEVARIFGRDPLELAIGGGEDYELLAVLPAAQAGDLEALAVAAGVPVTRIGDVLEGSGVEIRRPGGPALALGGFDQLG